MFDGSAGTAIRVKDLLEAQKRNAANAANGANPAQAAQAAQVAAPVAAPAVLVQPEPVIGHQRQLPKQSETRKKQKQDPNQNKDICVSSSLTKYLVLKLVRRKLRREALVR